MNLTKLFNFKYLKENFKKSKGLICLIILIVPVLTLLLTSLSLNNENYINVVYKEELMIIDLIGMYIIPIMISLILFGYVYKKNSVDFINSQPINRKSIFITNTIGGIILITLIQLLTVIALIVCNLLFDNIIIFPQIILDIFVVMWISYVFVFVATNVAMSISGTSLTQIALTMLILFLVPFCLDSYNNFDSNEYCKYNITDNYNKSLEFRMGRIDNFTIPYNIFHVLVSGNVPDLYSTQSNVKTIGLGIVYFFLGMVLFKKRKMENNEESFSNEKIHLIVKALTLVPMFILINIFDAGKEFNIFIIALMIIYYFLYDFIVKRKIKLKTSIIYLVLIMLVLQGFCFTMEKMKDNFDNKEIKIDNIANVQINQIHCYNNDNYRYSSCGSNNFSGTGINVTDPEIIEMLFTLSNKSVGSYYEEAEDVNVTQIVEEDTVIIEPSTMKNNYYTNRLSLVLETKDGRKFYTSIEFYEKDFDKILEKLNNDEKYVSQLRNAVLNNGKILLADFIILNDEDENIVKQEIENTVNKMGIKEILSLDNTTNPPIVKYIYENHKLIRINLKDNLTSKVLEIVSKNMNNRTINSMRKIDFEKEYRSDPRVIDKTTGEMIYFTGFIDEVWKFIYDNENEVLDPNKPYYVIRGYFGDEISFYTNKVNEIEEFIFKEMEYERKRNELEKYD